MSNPITALLVLYALFAAEIACTVGLIWVPTRSIWPFRPLGVKTQRVLLHLACTAAILICETSIRSLDPRFANHAINFILHYIQAVFFIGGIVVMLWNGQRAKRQYTRSTQ